MPKVNIDKMIADARKCIGSPYPKSGGGSTNLAAIQAGADVDCSGLIAALAKAQGVTLYHGSNTMWRDGCLAEKGNLTSASQLSKGELVFLNKPWAAKDASNRYYGDSVGNMSHVGLVLSVKPLEIIDASQSAGKVRITTSLSKVGWNRRGKMKAADYDAVSATTLPVDAVAGADKPIYKVIAQSGSTVNMRARPSKLAAVIKKIPLGEIVEGTGKKEDKWTAIKHGPVTGYIMTEFLEKQ